MSDRGAYKLV